MDENKLRALSDNVLLTLSARAIMVLMVPALPVGIWLVKYIITSEIDKITQPVSNLVEVVNKVGVRVDKLEMNGMSQDVKNQLQDISIAANHEANVELRQSINQLTPVVNTLSQNIAVIADRERRLGTPPQ